jgi:hypothetical protein
MFHNGLQKNFPTICLVLTAVLLFILNLSSILNNPFFPGDSGNRLDHAGSIIMTVGKHVWLPFLQMHIWALYKCGAPYWVFKLIPVIYSLIATLFLGLLAYRILYKKYWALLFSMILMVCFSFQHVIKFLSLNLYQEILETALLYVLLYLGALNLEKKWSLLIIATLALFTRETCFFYLLVITVINHKKIISDGKYLCSFLWLWSIPVFWLYFSLLKVRPFSSWPWFINKIPLSTKVHLNSLSNVVSAFQSSGIVFLALPW